MYCAPVDRCELESLINKLKNGKSPGADNIGVKMVKENAFILVDPLIHLFNLSITTGIVPDKLKIAKVVPVYKNKGETTFPGNYRPISLLSIFDKLLEKVMYSRLYKHLHANQILYQYQFGFRKKLLHNLGID